MTYKVGSRVRISTRFNHRLKSYTGTVTKVLYSWLVRVKRDGIAKAGNWHTDYLTPKRGPVPSYKRKR